MKTKVETKKVEQFKSQKLKVGQLNQIKGGELQHTTSEVD